MHKIQKSLKIGSEICYKNVKYRLTRTVFFHIIWNIKKGVPYGTL